MKYKREATLKEITLSASKICPFTLGKPPRLSLTEYFLVTQNSQQSEHHLLYDDSEPEYSIAGGGKLRQGECGSKGNLGYVRTMGRREKSHRRKRNGEEREEEREGRRKEKEKHM